jgi:hypothetical protein
VLSNECNCANTVDLLCYAGKAKEKDDTASTAASAASAINVDESDRVTGHQVSSDAATTNGMSNAQKAS